MSLTYAGNRAFREARYLDRDPRQLTVDTFYDGGIVKALRGRYSPALSTRLEFYRPMGSGRAGSMKACSGPWPRPKGSR